MHHIDSFSIYSDLCAQKSLKCTCPAFDPVRPLYFFFFFFFFSFFCTLAEQWIIHEKLIYFWLQIMICWLIVQCISTDSVRVSFRFLCLRVVDNASALFSASLSLIYPKFSENLLKFLFNFGRIWLISPKIQK